jgi:hypothetical protein
MKVKELFEVVMRPVGSTYTDEENAALKKDKVSRNDKAIDSLITTIKANCPNNFKALVSGRALPLYRSTHTNIYTRVGDYQATTITGRTEPRKSTTGDNLVMDYVSQAWKGVPRRNLSSSCAPNIRTAEQFGGATWLIIPFDNVELFASAPNDFNMLDPTHGSSDGIMDMMGWVQELRAGVRSVLHLLDDDDKDQAKLKKLMVGLFTTEINNFTLKDIQKLSDNIEKLIYFVDDNQVKIDSPKLEDFFGEVMGFEHIFDTRSLMEWLKEKITPKNLGIKTYTSYPALTNRGKESEIWFEGDYLCLRGDPGTYEKTEDIATSDWIKQVLEKL